MLNKLYILGVFCLSLLLFGCIAQPGTANQSNATSVEQIKYVCPNGNVVTAPQLCPSTTVKNLTSEEQLSVCVGMPEIQSGSLEDLCIEGLAAKNKNPSLCQEVSKDIRPSCYAIVAAAKNDMNVCADAGTSKDKCYSEYAKNKQDIAACDKITDVNNKDYCYYDIFNIVGDPTICDKMMNAGQKNGCYWNAAMRFQDTSYCNKITQSDQKQNCLQQLTSTTGGGGAKPPIIEIN